jgi:hypothetical protein
VESDDDAAAVEVADYHWGTADGWLIHDDGMRVVRRPLVSKIVVSVS